MKKSIFIIALLALTSLTSVAEIRPLNNEELSEVVGRNGVDNVILLKNDLKEFVRKNNNNVTADEINDFLQKKANLLGLRLNDVSVKGITQGGVPMTVQMNGVEMMTVNLPSHIDEIFIGSITVNSNNPDNRSFGSITISNINLEGTKILINVRTN